MPKDISVNNIKTLHLELGYACNLRCKMCFQRDFILSQKLSPKIWQEKLLPIYPQLKKLTLQGGEPTILPETKKVINLVQKHNPEVKLGIMTNGTFFDQSWQKIFTDNGYIVNFSLNAIKQTTYDQITQGGNWDKVITNLKDLVEQKQQKNSQVEICISFVILEENINQLAKFVEFGHQLNVDRIKFFFDPQMSLIKDNQRVYSQIKKAFNLFEKYHFETSMAGLYSFYNYYCNKLGLNNELWYIAKEIKLPGCQEPWQNLYINPHGKAYACCMSKLIIGDLNKDSQEDVWNNKFIHDFRKKMAKQDFRYCDNNCVFNKKPHYQLTLTDIKIYKKKFIYIFTKSPKVAFRKAYRKILKKRVR